MSQVSVFGFPLDRASRLRSILRIDVAAESCIQWAWQREAASLERPQAGPFTFLLSGSGPHPYLSVGWHRAPVIFHVDSGQISRTLLLSP